MRFKVLVRERARVRRVAQDLDAVVQLGHLRIVGHENIEDANASAAPDHARHFTDRTRGIGKMVQGCSW